MSWWKKEKKEEKSFNPATSPHPADRKKDRPVQITPVEKKPTPKTAVPQKRQTPEEAIKSRLTTAEIEKYAKMGVPLFELHNFYRKMNQVPKPDNLENDARVATELCREQGYDIENISPREMLSVLVAWIQGNQLRAMNNKPLTNVAYTKIMLDAEAAIRRKMGLPPGKAAANKQDFDKQVQDRLHVMEVIAARNRAEKIGLTIEELLTQESKRPGANPEGLKKIYTLHQKMLAEEIARQQAAKQAKRPT